MKVLIVATLMIVVAFQVNAQNEQPNCEINLNETSCISVASCATNNVTNQTYGCQWVSAVVTNTTLVNNATDNSTVLITPECSPSSINYTIEGPKYVCNKLTKMYADENNAYEFTFTMSNNWNKVNTTQCPAVVDVLLPTVVHNCSVAKIAISNCTKFLTKDSCTDNSTCNDAKHGCQWSQCSYRTEQLNGKNATNFTTETGKCVANTMSKGDLMTECCGLATTPANQKLLKTDATFQVNVTQLDNAAIGICLANRDNSTYKTCSLKANKPIVAKSTGMKWYWYVLICLLCMCVCGACGYGGHKEYKKKQAEQDNNAEGDYYAAQTGDHNA